MLHNQVEREANLLSLLAACLQIFLFELMNILVAQGENSPNAVGAAHC